MTVIHHDGIELPSGNLLLTVNDGSNYIEDTMIEINRETGEIEKTIDLRISYQNLFTKSMIQPVVRTARSIGSTKIQWTTMRRTTALLFRGGIKIRL